MARVETKRVRFKSGKFQGKTMTINAVEFNEALHEDAARAKPKPEVAAPKGRGKGK